MTTSTAIYRNLTSGTQRLVTHVFLTQEFTELTLYPRVHVTLVTGTQVKKNEIKHFPPVVRNSCLPSLSWKQLARELWTLCVNKALFLSRGCSYFPRTKNHNQNYPLRNSIQCRKLKPELKFKQGLGPVS